MNSKNNWKTIILGLISQTRSFFTRDYLKRAIVIWLLIFSLAINLAEWIILKIFIKPVDFPIILHYNVYFGVDMVGNYRSVFLLPLIGLVLLLVNFFLSAYFYQRRERIASYLLLMAALMIQLSLLVATLSIIIINY